MPRTDRPLESATVHHVALSVGDLDAMVSFYSALGFDEVGRMNFAPAPVRLVTIANQQGARLELTANDDSEPVAGIDPVSASQRRGLFHFALAVADLTNTVTAAAAAGARVVMEPTMNSGRDGEFAYISDPDGNLIELIGVPHADEPGVRSGAGQTSAIGKGSSESV